jgi:hypothetical protein
MGGGWWGPDYRLRVLAAGLVTPPAAVVESRYEQVWLHRLFLLPGFVTAESYADSMGIYYTV